DREGQDPFDLLDELENKLSIKVRPLAWPIGIGSRFQGVYNLYDHKLNLFAANKTKIEKDVVELTDIQDSLLDEIVGENPAQQLRDDVELIEGVYETFDQKKYLNGEIAPVFFGSALNNFGVKELLETFIRIAPEPVGRPTDQRE